MLKARLVMTPMAMSCQAESGGGRRGGERGPAVRVANTR